MTRQGAWILISGEGYRFQLSTNPDTGRVAGDFVNRDYPQLWIYDVFVDPDGRLHLVGHGPDMQGQGSETEYDDVFEIVSGNERRSVGRVRTADGTWKDFSRTTYRRKQSSP